MQDFGTKADNSPPPGGQLSAAEFNNLATENENAVLRAGLTLSGASSTQLAESMFLHGVKSESFQDSGVADAYVATPVSGSSGVLVPVNYTNLSGAVITFKASNSNTGASTLNIGQTTGALLGSKPIRTQSDSAIPAGSIVAGRYVQLIYNPALNSGGGAWEILPWAFSGGLLNVRTFTTNGTYTPTPGTSSIVVEVQGGGGGGGGTSAQNATNVAAGTGGGGGGYARSRLTSGFSGAAIVVGTGGAGGVNAAGTAGGGSSFGGTITAAGGGGGGASAGFLPPTINSSGGNGLSSGGNILNLSGGFGGDGFGMSTVSATSGRGGASFFGAGASPVVGNTNGNVGLNPGSGGSGSLTPSNGAARTGGAGAPGIVIITEYL